MIVVYHRNGKASDTYNSESGETTDNLNGSILQELFSLAVLHPEQYLIWCDTRYRDSLNLEALSDIFVHKSMIASYAPKGCDYLPEAIGYVDQSNFINIEKKVTYPTWRMSSLAGGIHASVLQFWKDRASESDFDYFLNSVAKSSMLRGLRCYSEPRLLLQTKSGTSTKANNQTLFKFVSQHYKRRWTALLLLCLIVYERKFPLWAFISCQFCSKIPALSQKNFVDETVKENMRRNLTIDVVIPTIGRKKYLYDTLQDLKFQTLLPNRIIIVEQNPLPGSLSELDYLTAETWPFQIIHVFTNQPGACNARNIALDNVESDWIFLADDDIRLEKQFLEHTFEQIQLRKAAVVNICCLTQNEKRQDHIIHQTTLFGSGCSILSKTALGDVRFNPAFEFGFGEDFDFGAQLTNRGFDTHYLPEPKILHMKAPSGGFRTKIKLAWSEDEIKPKPSPTVLLSKMLHYSPEQVNGYKTTLFFKNYKNRENNNPFHYLKTFKQRWNRSRYWANTLNANGAST